MQIQLDGAAIKELVAALEAAEGDDARAAVDKRIVKRGADIAKPDMARRIPRAADHKKSGSAWSKPSGGPAADNVPQENPKKSGDSYAAKVGWTLGHAENAAPRFCGAYRPGRGAAAAKNRGRRIPGRTGQAPGEV